MKSYSRKITAATRGIFVLMVLGVILFGISGEIFLPGELIQEEGRCETLSEGWVRVLPDGSNQSVEVPGRCPADRLESVSIETVLPENLEEDTWLCTMGTWQELELLVDQVVRQRYNAEGSKPFGTNAASAYVFLQLNREDAGKVFRITSVSNSPSSGVLNTVYIGDRMAILTELVKQHGGTLFFALFLLLLSGLSILFSVVLRRFYHKEIFLEYLAWGTFLTSFWLAAGSRLRQFLFPNISVAAMLSFLAAMLALFPLLIYMDGVQRQRYQKGYVVLEFAVIANFAICTFLQVTKQVEFMETAYFTCALAGICFLYILFCIYRDYRKRQASSYRLVAVGVMLLVISAAGQLLASLLTRSNGGMILCVGLVGLLGLAIVENVRKLFYMEREKQRAVLANESKGKFLENMSHEIRTPINTVIGMDEMILRENHDPVIREYAHNINGASKTLLSLVNDVLDFSKIESGRFEIDNSSYYLSSLLNDTFHVLKARAENRHLQVRLNVDEDLPSILSGDEVRIRKVLNFLFNNSIRDTQKGIITFSAEGAWSDDGAFTLIFSVADSGIGMSENELKKLNRGLAGPEEELYMPVGGDDLGLGMIVRFVKRMQGEIKAQSVQGAGTMFTVSLPQQVENAEPVGDLQKAYEREQEELSKPREFLKAPDAHVLSVDDNEMNLAVVRGLLKRTGLQLDTAISGEDCMDYTRRKKYDLIFMDHMMPEPDGISTLHRLRQETDNPNVDTPVVALTANAVAGSREEYLKAGFDEYLSKPVMGEKLEQMLQKYLPEEKVFFEMEKKVETAEDAGWEEILEGIHRQDTDAADHPQEPQETEMQELQETEMQEPPQEGLISQEAGMPYCGNDEEMYLEFLKAYYEQGQEYIKKLPLLYDEENWQDYGIVAHAVKSTSLTIGAAGLSEQAKRQELAAKENRIGELKEHWEEFYLTYQGVLKEAAQMLDLEEQAEVPKEEKATEEQPTEEFLAGCRVLLTQIEGYEMSEALEQADKLLSVRAEKMLEQVREFVNDFDYDSAERCLQEWLVKWEADGK